MGTGMGIHIAVLATISYHWFALAGMVKTYANQLCTAPVSVVKEGAEQIGLCWFVPAFLAMIFKTFQELEYSDELYFRLFYLVLN
jgi:hypothetical protein